MKSINNKSKIASSKIVSIILPFRGHSFMTSAKWNLLTAHPLTFTAIQFWSANQCPWLNSEGVQHLKNDVSKYSSETSTVRSAYLGIAFFFIKAHNVYKSHKYNKTNRKANTLLLTVCSYHVKYAFKSESTLYSCLNVK